MWASTNALYVFEVFRCYEKCLCIEAHHRRTLIITSLNLMGKNFQVVELTFHGLIC